VHKNNVVFIFLLFVKWNTIKHSYQQASTKDQNALISVIYLAYSTHILLVTIIN